MILCGELHNEGGGCLPPPLFGQPSNVCHFRAFMQPCILCFNFLNSSLLVISVDRIESLPVATPWTITLYVGLITCAIVPRTLTQSSSVFFRVSASVMVAVWSTTSLLFSCFAAMTRGAFPSRFIRDPVASFTRLRRSSGGTLWRTAAALALSFTTVSLSLMLATVEALLFGVDGYEGVPEWTTFAQEAIWGAAFGAMGKVV